jgi:GTPase
VMRTSLLLHLLDASRIDENDPLADWRTINHELELFDLELAKKPQIVVTNKIDLREARSKAELLAQSLPQEFQPLYAISAATREGLRTLMPVVGRRLEEIKQQQETSREAAGI